MAKHSDACGVRLLGLLLSLLTACGYVGDPLPPALRIPVAVNDLAAVQRGDRIIVQFTLPGLTSEGLAIDHFGDVDLRIGPGPNPWHLPTWEDNSTRIPVNAELVPGLVRVETPTTPWTGREVVIGVRTTNTRGRQSDWSNLASVAVVSSLATPASVTATPVAGGVRLTWNEAGERDGVRFRVIRRTGQTQLQLGETADQEWLDTGTDYGETYTYLVQAVAPAGAGLVESDITDPVSVTPTDVFAPPPPSGLLAVAGVGSIELTWEQSEDTGEVTYRVYRAEGDGDFRQISDTLREPAYSDASVVSGTRYRYAVTAIDEAGNESARSDTIEQVAP